MNKKLFVLIGLTLALGLFISACGGGDTEPVVDGTDPAVDEETITVGVFVSDSFGDRAFFDIALDGIAAIENEYGATVNRYEGKLDSDNFVTLLTQAASTDDLVFVLGFEAIDAMLDAAARNEDTLYVFLDAVLESPDVVSLGYKDHEGSFLAGALGGLLTVETDVQYINDDKVIGYVGGVDSPVMQRALWGYEQGINYTLPDGVVEYIFVGSWVDPAKGKEATLALIEKGSDINFAYAGLTGEGVFSAANEGAETWVIGGGFDQRWLAPDNTIASVMKAVDVSIFELTGMFLNGELVKGTDFNWGVAERGVYLVMSEDLVPAGIVAEVNEIQEKVAAGEITVTEFRN
jgi:basic membrane protein A and related proteins